MTRNEFGTPIIRRKCETCGREFSVCPAPEDDEDWKSCLDKDCSSYDPGRDVDKLFACGFTFKRSNGLIIRGTE